MSGKAAPAEAPAARKEKSTWWRTVLGEYPTGVAVITATHEEFGPVGMVVGTFSAVSENPPVVSFMPASASWSFARIAESGRFMVSILGSEHEDFCRRFASGSGERFTDADFETSDSGLRRVRNALAWFDADIADIIAAGDHSIVLGNVREYGVGGGAAGLPLIFLRGGYGSFAPPQVAFSPTELGSRLRMAEAAGPIIDALVADGDMDCALATVAHDAVVVVASENLRDGRGLSTMMGLSFPFAAPLSPALAAWSTPEREKGWIESARHLLGVVDRPLLAHLVAQVRDRGYAVSMGESMRGAFDLVISESPTDRVALADLWKNVQREHVAASANADWWREVCAIHVPVFGADGQACMELVVGSLPPFADEAAFNQIVDRALAAGRSLTATVGGVPPVADRATR